MANKETLGGIIHTYQKYDPQKIPGPSHPPADLVSPAFEHMMAYGSLRHLTEEELARAVHLDPSQIAGLGPSLDSLIAMLEERKRKILQTYETEHAQSTAAQLYQTLGRETTPPKHLRKRFEREFQSEQLRGLELLWYSLEDDRSPFARQLVQLTGVLGEKYQVDELVIKYEFTGRTIMDVAKALEIKEELETIDRLLEQLREAAQNAQIAIIDMDELARFANEADINQLGQLQRQIAEHVRKLAEQQGLEQHAGNFQLTPQAYRIFQGKLLERIFANLQASKSGRHEGPVVGEGAVETQQTKEYEFGDSVANMDITSTMLNAMARQGAKLPIRLRSEDIVVHKTRNTPKCATAVVLDMSGSMRYEGQYINVKRMGLALNGLIRSEYPGDFLQFIEMYSFAKPRHPSELINLMPKPVTIHDSRVALWADMSDPEISESQIPGHFTNIQRGLQLARQFLSLQDTPNRQIVLITDGLPTAHFEGERLFLLYPPDPRTEEATMREGMLCQREGITINMFLLPSWSQTEEDIRFAYRLAESTTGRVFFTAGDDLDRYVVWDYLNRRREIIS